VGSEMFIRDRDEIVRLVFLLVEFHLPYKLILLLIR
jgi:hypothetical protein